MNRDWIWNYRIIVIVIVIVIYDGDVIGIKKNGINNKSVKIIKGFK